MNKRVIHISWAPTIGGIQKLIFDLIRGQLESGQVTVHAFFAKNIGPYINIFNDKGIKCYTINLKSGWNFNLKKYFRFYKLLSNYDLVHIHDFDLFLCSLVVLSGKKIVYTEHGNFGIGRKLNLSEKINLWLLKIFIEKFVDHISFISDFTFNYSHKYYIPPKSRYSIVENGIKINEKNKIESSLVKNNEFIIGTSSRFVNYKNINKLIEAFIVFKYRDKAKLVLVGDGPERPVLEEMSLKCSLDNRIIFTGLQENVILYQSTFSLAVFPAENEPFGLVALELLSLGKPVIVFKNGGGLAEIINRIEPQDVVLNLEELNKRIEFYYLNPQYNKDQADKRIQFVKDNYDISITVNKFDQIYRKLLEN